MQEWLRDTTSWLARWTWKLNLSSVIDLATDPFGGEKRKRRSEAIDYKRGQEFIHQQQKRSRPEETFESEGPKHKRPSNTLNSQRALFPTIEYESTFSPEIANEEVVPIPKSYLTPKQLAQVKLANQKDAARRSLHILRGKAMQYNSPEYLTGQLHSNLGGNVGPRMISTAQCPAHLLANPNLSGRNTDERRVLLEQKERQAELNRRRDEEEEDAKLERRIAES